MVEVYYYLPIKDLDNAVDCGLKLSKWFDKEVVIEKEPVKCISALLCPKDDMEKYRDDGYKCVKLKVHKEKCFVGDKALYSKEFESPALKEIYEKSLIPISKYRFGTFRSPECLVTTTVIPGYINILNDNIDIPVLFDNSEDLYLNNIIHNFTEESCQKDIVMYYYLEGMTRRGTLDRIPSDRKDFAYFFDKEHNQHFVVKIPLGEHEE